MSMLIGIVVKEKTRRTGSSGRPQPQLLPSKRLTHLEVRENPEMEAADWNNTHSSYCSIKDFFFNFD